MPSSFPLLIAGICSLLLMQTDGIHVPGQVCHYWTRAFGCSPPPAISVWPQPLEMTVPPQSAQTPRPKHPRSVKSLKIICGGHCDDVLQMAMERYAAIINGSSSVVVVSHHADTAVNGGGFGRVGTSTAAGSHQSKRAVAADADANTHTATDTDTDTDTNAGADAAVDTEEDEKKKGRDEEDAIVLRVNVLATKSNAEVLNATAFVEMSEEYTLSVPTAGSATLTAATTLGALRGLETFAQLVDFTASPAPQIADTPIQIKDSPRFPYRGLRIDSSRHFLPMKTITATLDAMAASKLNVLMWHIVDGNSFPLKLDGFPELAEKGSFCPSCVYTSDDVRAVVEYARQRGIRVAPEIDVPGHSGWQYGRPDLVACPTYEAFGGCARALDMTQDAVYTFLKAFFLEVADLFPDTIINFCGDELRFECLDSNPRIKAWAAAKNMSYFDLEQYFWTRMNAKGGVVDALLAKGKVVVVAEGSSASQGSVKLNRFPKNRTIAEVWGGTTLREGVYNVLSNNTGVKAILGGPYYLDMETPGEPAAQHYGWMDTWRSFYNSEPFLDDRLTDEMKSRVLGGAAEQWSEQVDASSIQSRIWPRALAIAERFWSPQSTLLVENKTVARLQKASCQVLERRGVRGGPVASGFCPWSLDW